MVCNVASCFFQCQTIDMVYPVDEGVSGLVPAIDRICKEVR